MDTAGDFDSRRAAIGVHHGAGTRLYAHGHACEALALDFQGCMTHWTCRMCWVPFRQGGGDCGMSALRAKQMLGSCCHMLTANTSHCEVPFDINCCFLLGLWGFSFLSCPGLLCLVWLCAILHGGCVLAAAVLQHAPEIISASQFVVASMPPACIAEVIFP